MNVKHTPGLETERLQLRPITISDRWAFFEIFSDAEALEYWSREPIKTMEESDRLLRKELDWAASGSCMSWGIEVRGAESRGAGGLIGKVVLFAVNEQNRRAEIGYILGRPYWRKGYMSEALTRVLAYAFDELHLHRIEADTDPNNQSSLALLQRLGFRREGLFRDRWWVNGKWHDSVMFGLLDREFLRFVRPLPRSGRAETGLA
jgi:RimJ/RimL family protein N-acetyltransferase